jgi:hypothetical protein
MEAIIMGKFDLSKFDGVLGIGLLGGTISCFIVYMICNIIAGFPENLPEVTELAVRIGFYTMLTGSIILAVGFSFLMINALHARHSESGGTPTSHVLIVLGLTTAIIIISLIVPEIIS